MIVVESNMKCEVSRDYYIKKDPVSCVISILLWLFVLLVIYISKTSSIKILAPHWFGGSLEIKIQEDSAQPYTNNTYELISVNYSSSKKVAGLKVFINGKAVDCKINESNYAPVSYSWGI